MDYLDKETLDKIISEYENENIEYHKKWIEKTEKKIIQELNFVFRKCLGGEKLVPPFNPEWIDFEPFGCTDYEGNIIKSRKVIDNKKTSLSVFRLNIPGLSQIHTTVRTRVGEDDYQATDFIDKWIVVFDNGKKQCDTLLEALSVARGDNND